MRMSKNNNNSDYPLISHRTDGGKNWWPPPNMISVEITKEKESQISKCSSLIFAISKVFLTCTLLEFIDDNFCPFAKDNS